MAFVIFTIQGWLGYDCLSSEIGPQPTGIAYLYGIFVQEADNMCRRDRDVSDMSRGGVCTGSVADQYNRIQYS